MISCFHLHYPRFKNRKLCYYSDQAVKKTACLLSLSEYLLLDTLISIYVEQKLELKATLLSDERLCQLK